MIKLWKARSLHSKLVAEMAVKGFVMTEDFRQKWTFVQGQLLTKGRMRWNWSKVWQQKTKK